MAYTIRFHRKSRKGCNGCKARHIKCNEAKPQCSACTRRGVECVYVENASSNRPAATRSPSRPSPSASDPTDSRPMTACFDQQSSSESHYSAKHMLDLRLMHHYNTSTAQFFGSAFPGPVLDAFQERIPQLAFKHDFLMDAILLVSMLHLGCTDHASLESLPIYFYRDQALRTLRGAVVNVSPDTVHAVLGASVLHTTVSFAMDRITKQPGLWIVSWLTLVLGQRNFRTYAFSSPTHSRALTPNSPVDEQIPRNHYGSFLDIPDGTYDTIAIDLQHVLARESRRYGDNWASSGILRKAASELSRLIATLDSPREEAWLEKKIKAWAFDVVPSEFIELVRQEQPAALIILAYYLSFFQFLPDTWPYQGVTSHDLGEICNIIDPAYKEYLAVPERALQTNNKIALTQVLVSSLPGRD